MSFSTMENKLLNIPVTMHKDINTVLLSWDNILLKYENLELEYMLFIKTKHSWNYVYR